MDNDDIDKLSEKEKDKLIQDFENLISDRKFNNWLLYKGYIRMLKITDEMNKSIINIKTTNSLTK